MSIASLFIKTFGEDIFEKLPAEESISKDERSQQDTGQKEEYAEFETARHSTTSQKTGGRSEEMCLPGFVK